MTNDKIESILKKYLDHDEDNKVEYPDKREIDRLRNIFKTAGGSISRGYGSAGSST